MTDDQHGESTPQGAGRWDPLPQGDYDDGATAFVKLPEGGVDALLASDSPLAAPGHGYVPPRIAATPGTDPHGGAWAAPAGPAEGSQWPDPNAVPQDAGNDRFTYHPGATQQWNFSEHTTGHEVAAPAPGHDVTGQWSIPVAGGDIPDESGEFTTSSLVEQWGGTPPATLPGGASAPWAAQPTGQPWGQQAEAAAATQESPGTAHPAGQPGTHTGQRPAEPGDPRFTTGAGGGPAVHAGEAPFAEPGEQHAPHPHEQPPAAHGTDGSDPAAYFRDRRGPGERSGPDEHARVEHDSAHQPHARVEPDPARQPHPHSHAPEPQQSHAPGAEQPYAEAPAAPAPEPETAQPVSEAGEAAEDTPGGQEAPEASEGPSEPPAEPADADPAPEAADAGTPGEPAPALPGEEHPLASYVLRVNGVERPVSGAWIGESLLYVLRERLGLAGAKDGCSQGECGACNVQVDGRLVASCLVPAVTAAGSEVRTVEGLAEDGQPSDVQRALARCGAVQCGFCVPGMAMTLHDLLEGNPAPTELETRQALCGNLCRCSGYRGVVEAVKEVVAEREAHHAAAETETDADEARIPHQAGPGAGGVNPSAFEAHGSPGRHDQAYGQDGGQA
jgi:aerobic-type carbon monoxide dehydrogenase small subunit (CoxS/CutS family)